MKKTIEQLTKEFADIMTDNGFETTGEANSYGNAIFSREWTEEVDVVWYGRQTSTMEIRAHIGFGIPVISIIRNGRQVDARDYSSPKRAINAIKEIVKCAGFEF